MNIINLIYIIRQRRTIGSGDKAWKSKRRDWTHSKIGHGLVFYKLGGYVQGKQTREGLDLPAENWAWVSLKQKTRQGRQDRNKKLDEVTGRRYWVVMGLSDMAGYRVTWQAMRDGRTLSLIIDFLTWCLGQPWLPLFVSAGYLLVSGVTKIISYHYLAFTLVIWYEVFLLYVTQMCKVSFRYFAWNKHLLCKTLPNQYQLYQYLEIFSHLAFCPIVYKDMLYQFITSLEIFLGPTQ